MKTIEIKGTLRKELGKKSTKQIRKEGNVPCVLYADDNNIHFFSHENSFKKLIYTHEAHLVNIKLEDKQYKAVLHETQFHPVTDRLLHADFIPIIENKPVIIEIPVTITGESVGVKAGGKLSVKRRHLKVKGLPEHLPEEIHVDVTDLKIHNSLKVGDLSFENLELLDPKIVTVVTVGTARVSMKTEEEEAAEAEAEAEAAEAGAEEEKAPQGQTEDKDKGE